MWNGQLAAEVEYDDVVKEVFERVN